MQQHHQRYSTVPIAPTLTTILEHVLDTGQLCPERVPARQKMFMFCDLSRKCFGHSTQYVLAHTTISYMYAVRMFVFPLPADRGVNGLRNKLDSDVDTKVNTLDMTKKQIGAVRP